VCVCVCVDSGVHGKRSQGSATAAAMDNVATVASVGNFSLQKTISNIEQRLDSARLSDDGDIDDDVLPAAANDMGVGQC